MADIVNDGKIKVSWVPTIAVKAAPTVTEIEAGQDLEELITADGLVGFEAETAEVDTTSIASTFDYKQPGRASFSGTLLRLKKQSATDTAFTTLVRGTAGYVVIRRYVDSTDAWAAEDEVSVYPVVCGETRELTPEANTVARYEVPMMVSSMPALRAVVAAGA